MQYPIFDVFYKYAVRDLYKVQRIVQVLSSQANACSFILFYLDRPYI
jgi:hypothetical protein